uniref:Myosin_tail_1 domain-containing protein n=1 Tax=Soboliphyme baturini TaxID=241478 RepID=A0A183IS85_9BILA
LSKKLGVVQKKHDTVQGQLREAEIQNDALQKDVEGLRGGKQADHEKAKKLNDDLQLARDENAKLVKQMESLKEDNMKLRSEVAELQGKLSSQNRVIVNEKAEIRDEKKQEPLPPPMKEKKTNEKAIADDIGLKKAMGNLQKSQVDSPKFAVDNNAVDNDEMKNVLRKPEISDKDVHQRAAALQAPFDNDVKALKKRDDDIDVADKDEQVDGDGAEIQQKPVDLLFDVKKDTAVSSCVAEQTCDTLGGCSEVKRRTRTGRKGAYYRRSIDGAGLLP